jgi:hypothetical protein
MIVGLLSCENKFDFFLDFIVSKIPFTALLNDLLDTWARRTVQVVHIYNGEKFCIANEALLGYYSPSLASFSFFSHMKKSSVRGH